jgi:hypothetical protein
MKEKDESSSTATFSTYVGTRDTHMDTLPNQALSSLFAPGLSILAAATLVTARIGAYHFLFHPRPCR